MTVTQITQAHIDELESLLLNGDRGGFYLRYYELSGSQQALLQAHISTYSGFAGGAALFGNAIAKFSNPSLYTITLDQFSEDIAWGLFDGIDNDVNQVGGSGIQNK